MNRALVAGWSLTRMCNLNCMHCYSSSGRRSQDELTTEEALSVADKLKDAGVQAVNFGGGECCLRKDFLEICSYLRELGMKISYTTNGTAFRLIEPGLGLFHDVGVSVDFADPSRHDWFRGIPGTFQKAVSAARTLVERGVNTEIVTCLTKLNCSREELQKIYELCRSLGADYWRINRFRENGRGAGNSSTLSLSKEDLRKAYTFLSGLMGEASVPDPLFRAAFGGKYSIEGDPSGFTAFRIQADGSVTPSVFLSESGGNIREKSLEEILDSGIFRSIRDRRPQGKCLACPSYSHCRGGDAGASFLKYGHFHGPDPLCWLEPGDRRRSPVKCIPSEWNVHEMYLCTVYIPIKGKEVRHEARKASQA